MIYLDTSVALARLLAEDVSPPETLWDEVVVSSRLLEYELWTRLNALERGADSAEDARQLLGRIALVRLEPRVLARALEPFPHPVRTLDAMHLATMAYLLDHGQKVELASYDRRMTEAATALGWKLFDLS
ncbi:MAG: PIN domain-containing protein [Planctomycetes bacterium]|nr:PIN domain-containing protein [Planctomycetota bacterium]